MSKTPKIDYSKPVNYNKLNDYQKDAVYLVELIKQSYPRLNNKISENDFLNRSNGLIQNLESITTSFEFEVHLQEYIAKLKDGHTEVQNFPISLKEDKNYFNWGLIKEKESWIISLIDSSLDVTLLGQEIVAINGVLIEEISEKVNNFESGENQYYRLSKFASRVKYPKYLVALGISETEHEISFSIERNGKIEKHYLKSKPEFNPSRAEVSTVKYPFSRKQNDGFSYSIDKEENFAYLQMNTCLDYITYKSELRNYTSFFFRPFAKIYLKKDTKDARDFGLVLQRLFSEIHDNDINNLIIDLRRNGGGDERLGKQLIWYLTEETNIKSFTDYLQVSEHFKKTAKEDYKKYNDLYEEKHNEPIPEGEINLTEEFYSESYFEDVTKHDSPYLLDSSIVKFKGNVYVIVGTQTFSAAQVLATTISDNELGEIVGTPLGNMPTCQTGVSLLKLPKTNTIVSISYFYMERPDKSRNHEVSLFPDIEVYQTYTDGIKGVDSVIEEILKEMKR